MKRPNILFIQADQMAGPALPMYGNSVVKTPHLENLAEKGTTFKNAYCNNPICAPSRGSMLTGQLTSRIGAYDNAAEFPSSIPTFVHYLRDLGYKTCLSGKMHFVGPDQLHGFEERITTDIYPSDFAWTPDWTKVDEPFSPSGISLRSVVEAGICKRSLQIDYDEEVEYQAIKKMFEYARAPVCEEKPFFLAVSFAHPHNPYVARQEYWELYSDEDINMPSVSSIPYEKRDPWSQRFFRLIRQDEQELTAERIRKARHGYYAAISYIDDKVGRLLNVLSECGFDDNTVVAFTSDHGDMMGERGMFYKFNPFEWSVRVPLIIRQPGAKKGRVEEKGVSLVDLLPTFLNLATDGNPPDLIEPIDGKNLAPTLYGDDSSCKDTVMIEYTGEGTHSPCLIVRKDGFKYIYCEHDPGMLFDLN
ncbi:MAG: choline-sulfatase, partial [Planctomycetota bacterium]